MFQRQFASSASVALTGMGLFAVLCIVSVPSFGQSAYDGGQSIKTQQQTQLGNDQQVPSVQTFSGRITKSVSRFVLMDLDNKTTYQLDDQQKAREFLNKSVKVTGVLDATTGTIRITEIQLF